MRQESFNTRRTIYFLSAVIRVYYIYVITNVLTAPVFVYLFSLANPASKLSRYISTPCRARTTMAPKKRADLPAISKIEVLLPPSPLLLSLTDYWMDCRIISKIDKKGKKIAARINLKEIIYDAVYVSVYFYTCFNRMFSNAKHYIFEANFWYSVKNIFF